MDRFEGKCVGGPLDGQMLVHWSRKKELFRPCGEYMPVNVGEYRINDFGQWHWWETDEGRAYATLFGVA